MHPLPQKTDFRNFEIHLLHSAAFFTILVYDRSPDETTTYSLPLLPNAAAHLILAFRPILVTCFLVVTTTCIQAQTTQDKLPVPSDQKQTEALALIKSLFEKDYAAAKTNAQKLALAEKLLDVGIRTNDDPAGKYVLLREATNLASEAGNVTVAKRAQTELSKTFETGFFPIKGSTDEAAGKSGSGRRASSAPSAQKHVAALRPRTETRNVWAVDVEEKNLVGFVRFRRLDGDRWKETYFNKATYDYTQVFENHDYIEIFDKSRKLRVRLHSSLFYKLNPHNRKVAGRRQDLWIEGERGYWLE